MSGTARRVRKLRAIIRSVPGTGQAQAAAAVLGKIQTGEAEHQGLDISKTRGWKVAVIQIVRHRELADACFSAGEIAREIRLARPDLRFSVEALTKFVGRLTVEYGGQSAVIVQRVTTGATRTPAGRTVEIYAPSVVLAMGHDFEVDIPAPGMRKLTTGDR